MTYTLPSEEKFCSLFETYADELFGYAVSRISDRERAVELTQECFLRAWKYVAQGGIIERHRSFLYRTLHNLIVDEYRRGNSQSLESLLEQEDSESLIRDDADPWEEAVHRFESQSALAALRALPLSYRTILELRYIQGLSPEEAGTALNASPNTVSVRTHRAVKKLREAFAKLESPHSIA